MPSPIMTRDSEYFSAGKEAEKQCDLGGMENTIMSMQLNSQTMDSDNTSIP